MAAAGFLPRFAGTGVVAIADSFFCIVEMIFVLFGDNAITTGLIGGVKLNMSHIARCCLFRSGGLCQYGLLAIWPVLSVVGSKCEQQS
ncbi:conserved hypothetical protein [Klebsiella quasipneumoniae subsp. quasipneumoniae]|nr:conserved hypothetical protein [Klebsiella quasipneumoniae subsp. quasipneumoniae]CDQ17161.1 conserved hypothetical protein [Klebsiella quasipneumoniae subsp. quasipneumoniae]